MTAGAFQTDEGQTICRQTHWLLGCVVAVTLVPAAMGQQPPPQQPPSLQPDVMVAIRSAFIERLVADTRTEEQPVSKSLLRSDVTGCQTTITDSRLRIIPGSRPLQFEIQTSGRVRSQTTGINPDAIVESVGTHQFQVIKPFWFDGRGLKTQRSHGVIQAFQTPQKVFSTAGARMPLLAPLTNQIAWNRVRQMQPQINQVVAEDLSRDILPKVDRTIEQEFIGLDQRWQQTRRQMNSLFSSTELAWTAAALEQTVQLSLSSTPGGSAGAAAAELLRLQSEEDIVASISADALSHLICSSLPSSLRLTDTQLQQISQLLPDLMGRQPEALTKLTRIVSEPATPAFFTVEFPTERPMEFRCINGDLQLVLRFRIQPSIAASSGWMSTTLSFRGKRLSRDTWTVAVNSLDVSQADESEVAGDSKSDSVRPRSASEEPVRAGTVWPTLVRSRLQSLLDSADPPAIPREFLLPMAGRGDVRLHLQYADARDGRLEIALRAVESSPRPLAGSLRTTSPNKNGTGR